MNNFLYAISALLIIFWGIAFYGLKVDSFIHILPVIAIVTIGYVFFKKTEIADKNDSDAETEITKHQIIASSNEVDLA